MSTDLPQRKGRRIIQSASHRNGGISVQDPRLSHQSELQSRIELHADYHKMAYFSSSALDE